MDAYEAVKAVFSRIQGIDPENAHKIVGYILLKDQAEKELIRLAFAPENLIRSVVALAKSELGLSSNTSSASSSSPSFSTSPFASSSSNLISVSTPNCYDPCSSPSLLPVSAFHEQNLPFFNDFPPLELPSKNPVFLDQPLSPSRRSESSPYPFGDSGSGLENSVNYHRRSCSVNDLHLGAADDSTPPGFPYKPCLYFSRGFCKNGSACKFVHGNAGFINSPPPDYPSPNLDQFHELMRYKFAHQQRLMAGLHIPYNKLGFLPTEAQRSAVAELMLGEEFQRLNRLRMGRNGIPDMGYGDSAPSSRQIYLTFPADSSFKEEDVSDYFSMYGPVQDVRIPYQQKRMFGFVTFLYPETVKTILAKGNPHFVCDSRVLVKPYKEKGKLLDKKQHPERSELDCRESFEMHVGPRLFQNNREALKKKLEQEANWQEEAFEYQRKRLMSMHLLDHHQLNPSAFPVEEGNGNPSAYPTEEPQQKMNGPCDGDNGNRKEGEPGIKASSSSDTPESQLAEKSQTAHIIKPAKTKDCNGGGVPTSTV